MMSAAQIFKQYLTDELAAGNFAPGAKLPPERLWAEKFSISRGTVRRVLKALEDDGRVESIMGSGTFVLPDANAAAPSPIYASPAELMEARLHIEPMMPELIVRNANNRDFEMMAACLEQAENTSDIQEFEDLDKRLHQLFATATHNSFFVHIMELVGRARQEGGWGRLKERTYTVARHQKYMQQHRHIVEALKNRDLPLSKQLMAEHLITIRENLFGN